MSNQNEYYPKKEAEQLLEYIKDNYTRFYENSPSEKDIFKKKSANSENAFWEQLRKDTVIFVSKDFTYVASSVYKFFKANLAVNFKRRFKNEQIEYLKELPIFYETHIYDPKTHEAILRDRDTTRSESSINESKPFTKTNRQSQKIAEPETNGSPEKLNQIKPIVKTPLYVPYYKNYLKKKFQFSRLKIMELEIPINEVIELSLIELDKEKEEELRKLKLKIRDYNFESNSRVNGVLELQNQIDQIGNSIRQNINFIKELKNGKDIFICSPAGTGKTTLLQWLVHCIIYDKVSLSKIDLIPILIPLKLYLKGYNLKKIIEQQLSLMKVGDSINPSQNYILLLDGFDEYKGGNPAELLDEIKLFKEHTNAQIVFTGRAIPKYINRDLDFQTFRIHRLNDPQIKEIFKSVLPNLGEKLYNKLNFELKDILDNPLYLMLLLGHIKKNKLSLEDNSKYAFKSKGEFLQKVLIDEFILNYEIERDEKLDVYKIDKKKQIEIISYIGYYLTIELNDSEIIERGDLEGILDKFMHKYPNYSDLTSRELVTNFISHNILESFGNIISFSKKEIKHFFASSYICEYLIKNRKDYIELTKYSKSGLPWSVLSFIFEIINPSDKLIDLTLEKKYKGEYLLTKELFDQIGDYFSLSYYRNSPNKGDFKSIIEITDSLSRIIINHYYRNKNYPSYLYNKRIKYWIINQIKNSSPNGLFHRSGILGIYNADVLNRDVKSGNGTIIGMMIHDHFPTTFQSDINDFSQELFLTYDAKSSSLDSLFSNSIKKTFLGIHKFQKVGIFELLLYYIFKRYPMLFSENYSSDIYMILRISGNLFEVRFLDYFFHLTDIKTSHLIILITFYSEKNYEIQYSRLFKSTQASIDSLFTDVVFQNKHLKLLQSFLDKFEPDAKEKFIGLNPSLLKL